MLLAATLLVFELSRESLTGTHCRYREYVDGLPTDHYVTRPCDAEAAMAMRADVPAPGNLRVIDGRRVRREIVEEAPYQPYAHDYDVATGALIRRTPLFYRAKPARVFDPNPVAKLNAPELQDLGDQSSHIPPQAYSDVVLEDRAPDGVYVTLVDRQPRHVPPPTGELLFDRTADGFEDVNAYFHIDRNQRYLQSLGFRDLRAIARYAVPVDAHAASGEDSSFFVPNSSLPGQGTLYFGEGGTDDAEDADLLIHEYAHAIHEWIAPATFAGSFGSEARAFSEALADYWAFSAHYETRLASGRDPFCLADWDARCWLDAESERCGYAPGSDCLRRVDSPATMADYVRGDVSGIEHRNSAIFSSALREIRTRLPRAVADTIVIESLFGAPPRPTFATMALRLLQADQQLYQGRHAGLICSAMYARGILTGCDVTPRGEITHFQSAQRGLAIPDNDPSGVTSTLTIDDPRAIEEIFVRVDIEHGARGDLRIELVAPDGTTVLLQDPHASITPDLHTTFGLTAVPARPLDVLRGRSAAGTWTLRVTDLRRLDAGRLLSWGLDVRFAGEEPRTARPRSTESQMIPVVARVFGEQGTWTSELRIANPSTTSRTATLIFTPSGANGLERFAAVDVVVPPGHTLVFDDVVDRLFHTAGSGSLEVLGDVRVISRTTNVLGQEVPATLDATFLGAPPLLVAPLPDPGARDNFGVTETDGARGTVRVGERTFDIEPFSHVQFPVGLELLEVRVVSGSARVVAYVSHLVERDAMFIPAERVDARRVRVVPAITGQTSSIPSWRTDLWLASAMPAMVRVDAPRAGGVQVPAPVVLPDVLARLFHRSVTYAVLRVTLPAGVFGATRTLHGSRSQYIPLLDPEGPLEQHLVFAGAGPLGHRINVGIATDRPAVAEVIVYDATGAEVQRTVTSTDGGFAQMRVANGARAVVRFLLGTGRAYASVIDHTTGDAAFVQGR